MFLVSSSQIDSSFIISHFHLEIATKQDLRARPSKIVAGLEAEKTNEFLIAIARAIDRKVDTTEAVTQVKSGNVSSPRKKDPKAAAPTKSESRSKGGKDAKVKSSDAKPSKKTDGNKKVAATKQSSKDANDAKKSRSRTQSQGKDQKENEKRAESDKKSSPKIREPETKTETQPNVVNDIQSTNGTATVSSIRSTLCNTNNPQFKLLLTHMHRVTLLMIRNRSQTFKMNR